MRCGHLTWTCLPSRPAGMLVTMPESQPPKRRWYQYTLRMLFVLVTLSAVACSWYAYEMHKAAERRAAIAEIRRHGMDRGDGGRRRG